MISGVSPVAGEQTVVWVHSPRRETVELMDAVLLEAVAIDALRDRRRSALLEAVAIDAVRRVEEGSRSLSGVITAEGVRTDAHSRVNGPA